MEFVILNGKTPANKFKEKGLPWEEVKDFDNIGLIVPKGYLVLDFDTEEDAEIMLKIIEAKNLNCRVIKTTRGIHCYFKKGNIDKCFTKARLAVGIYADCKNGTRRSYVKIKQDGKMRKTLKKANLKEVQEIPRWLYPVDAPSDKFHFKGMKDGDGRNQELFNYIVYLQSKGFKKNEIKEAINVVNEFVFAKPLPDFEIKTLLRDEAFKPDEEIEAQQKSYEIKTKGFKHNEFGDDLIEAFNIITVNNQLYVYDDGYYQQDERIIERKMIELYPSIKQRDRVEVLAYIKIKTHMTRDKIKINPYTLNLKNTRLDLRNLQLMDFTPEAIEFSRIPVTYDPNAYCEDVAKMLHRVFLDDEEILDLFEEMLGACLIRHNRYQKAFMLWGSGSNGKSTVLDMIKHFLGRANYCSIDLDKLTDKFSTAELENMLANISDDVNDVAMKETGTLKKLFSGNSIMVQRKNERPFMLEPYTTHIFSCNSLPRSFDKSDGFYRRWIFIPFNAKFSTTDPDYDPMIEDKVMTDEAMSYLLNMAIRGAQRLIRNKKFTEPKQVNDLLEAYIFDNSNVLSWIDDNNYTVTYLLDTPTTELYSDFVDWCKNSGIKTANINGKKSFYRELSVRYKFEPKPKQRGDGKRYFNMEL